MGLTIEIEGQGTVTRDPDAAGYAEGTNVWLNAAAQDGWVFSQWIGAVSDTGSAQTSITMTADETVTCVFIPIVGDTDNDGIADTEENGPDGTDLNYDGNGDQIPDAHQSNVTSAHTADGQHYITLAAEAGLDLTNVLAIDRANMPNPPTNASFDWGFFRFTITKVPAGTSTTVQLFLPAAARPDTYYKYGPSAGNPADHWYEFPFDAAAGHGAEINLNVVTIHVKDGGLGDDDLTANGQITDDGGPAIGTLPPGSGQGSTSSTNSGGGGGGCFINMIW